MQCDACQADAEPRNGRIPDGWFAVHEDNGAVGTTHFCSAACVAKHYAQRASLSLSFYEPAGETETTYFFRDADGHTLTVPKT